MGWGWSTPLGHMSHSALSCLVEPRCHTNHSYPEQHASRILRMPHRSEVSAPSMSWRRLFCYVEIVPGYTLGRPAARTMVASSIDSRRPVELRDSAVLANSASIER